MISPATSEGQTGIKQVLMLQSLDRGNLILDNFTGEFRVRLDQRVGQPVNVVQVVVGPVGFVGASEQSVVDYIKSLYHRRPPPDLIVTGGGPAAVFARKYRQQLFPATPVLYAAVDQQYLGSAPLGQNETAVAVVNDYPGVVDDILRVVPDTRQIFMVMGSGPIGLFWRRRLESAFSRFRGRVAFIWSDQLSLQEIVSRVASLPPHSAIFYILFGTDAQGGAYADEQVLSDIHARANSPLFAAHTSLFGTGIVGGHLIPVSEMARNAVDVAGRILDGESAGSIRLPPQLRNQSMFDWRELQRWNIPESRLPPGSVVKFRPPGLWDQNRVAVLTATGALILQSFVIALLLYERRARQRAEAESRRNLALAADANRRETISALTSSIGHELGQPLSAIMHNAQTLQMMVESNRAPPDVTGEIAIDIQAETALAGQIIERHRMMLRGHQLQKRPIDLHRVIEESIALLAYDMRARHVDATLELSAVPCIVDGDQVLLEQVLVNLLRNAIDALAEMPVGRRHIIIRSAVNAGRVEMSVADTGPGLPAEILDTLFTPFVTTKSHGLGIGLAIVQRIVEAHRGTITARRNADDAGATFVVSLPAVSRRSSENGSAPYVHSAETVAADAD